MRIFEWMIFSLKINIDYFKIINIKDTSKYNNNFINHYDENNFNSKIYEV